MIEDILRQPADEPGVAVSVIRGSAVVAQECVGLANLAYGITIGPQTRFHVVSVSKTFMAAAILLLADRGALSLDDDVRRHIPELPTEIGQRGTVTIRHLLSMTSGLRDVLEIERLRGEWRSSPSRVQDLLDLAYRQRAVSAAAGAQYMYANVNALLLEQIVTRASGMSAEAFRHEVLYQPLGLSSTCARPHDGIVLGGLAEPYVPDGSGGWQRASDLLGIAADPITTSLNDLTRWLLALRRGSIGGIQVTSAMAERARLTDGRPVYYGLGLAVRRYRGVTVLCHTGSQPGYKAHIAYVPELDFGLVILSNREDTRPAVLATAIMEEVIGDDFPTPSPAASAARRLLSSGFTPEQQSALEGHYVDPQSGEWVSLSFEAGVVKGETLGDPFFLYPESGSVFRDGDDYRATVPVELSLEFGPDPGEARGSLNLGGQDIALFKDGRPRDEPSALSAFTGLYESAEVNSQHLVWVEDNGLIVAYGLGLDRGRAFPMEPIGRDLFLVRPHGSGIDYRHVFRFERDPRGTVVAAVVTMERLKGVHLCRVQQASAP